MDEKKVAHTYQAGDEVEMISRCRIIMLVRWGDAPRYVVENLSSGKQFYARPDEFLRPDANESEDE